jgi:hypothetical protein
MFDWPEPSHTSPTSTSLTSMLFVPFTVRASPSATCSGSSFTCHLPCASAVVVFDCPAMATLMVSPGEAVPQIGAALSRWSTM